MIYDDGETWDRIEKDGELIVYSVSHWGSERRIIARLPLSDVEQAYKDATTIINAHKHRIQRETFFKALKDVEAFLARDTKASRSLEIVKRRVAEALTAIGQTAPKLIEPLEDQETFETLENLVHHFKGPVKVFTRTLEAKRLFSEDIRGVQRIIKRIKDKRDFEHNRAVDLVQTEKLYEEKKQ